MWGLPNFLSAGGAIFLGVLLYHRRTRNPVFFALALVMAVIAWIQGLNGMLGVFPQFLLMGKQGVLLGELVFPAALAYVTATVLQHLSLTPSPKNKFKFFLIGTGSLVLSFGLLVWPDFFLQKASNEKIVFSQNGGIVIWGFILLGLVVGLSQLEQILSGIRDPLRFQMKFVLIGLGGLAGISIAQASQLLLLPVWTQNHAWVSGTAACISLALMAFGLARWRLHDLSQKIQMSHQALYTSLTFIFVGGYLILVGIVAEVIKETGWAVGEALGALFIFVTSIALVIVGVSRQARAEVQQFVSRHFFRTKYDYRQKWLEITEIFSTCTNRQHIWDRYLEWLGRTFGASRVTIWKRFEVDGRFHQIRTVNSEDPPAPMAGTHVLVQRMLVKKEPFLLEVSQHEREECHAFLQGTEAHICVPLVTPDGILLGFATLSRDLGGRRYDPDDFDLLRAIAHHVTMLLIQFELAEERTVAAKWEAVHKFSGFYLHDLKNLASSLSMVVQNAEHYGHDPEFLVSAMRTLRTTSERMTNLIAKLARQTKGLEKDKPKKAQAVDMNTLIQETLESLNGAGCRPTFHPAKNIPKRLLEVESIKLVLLNIILNARQAMDGKGTIDIVTSPEGHGLKVEIIDNGPGIPRDRLENVFQPFKSSKQTGLGVGLYQCKQIIEDNHGQIRIESQEGRGTKVILTFLAETADI